MQFGLLLHTDLISLAEEQLANSCPETPDDAKGNYRAVSSQQRLMGWSAWMLRFADFGRHRCHCLPEARRGRPV
ncbi:hypothetical protein FHX63_005546 [Cupriavidus plantarum]|nr:hypothetical protein [Cupriavidus plantarum]